MAVRCIMRRCYGPIFSFVYEESCIITILRWWCSFFRFVALCVSRADVSKLLLSGKTFRLTKIRADTSHEVSTRSSRVVNPKLEYLYYGAHIVSHCLCCRIKPGKRMSCFLVKKFVRNFGWNRERKRLKRPVGQTSAPGSLAIDALWRCYRCLTTVL